MSSPKPPPAEDDLPEIPECQVTRGADGLLRLTHTTGRTATASTARGAILVGVALRTLATLGDASSAGDDSP